MGQTRWSAGYSARRYKALTCIDLSLVLPYLQPHWFPSFPPCLYLCVKYTLSKVLISYFNEYIFKHWHSSLNLNRNVKDPESSIESPRLAILPAEWPRASYFRLIIIQLYHLSPYLSNTLIYKIQMSCHVYGHWVIWRHKWWHLGPSKSYYSKWINDERWIVTDQC